MDKITRSQLIHLKFELVIVWSFFNASPYCPHVNAKLFHNKWIKMVMWYSLKKRKISIHNAHIEVIECQVRSYMNTRLITLFTTKHQCYRHSIIYSNISCGFRKLIPETDRVLYMHWIFKTSIDWWIWHIYIWSIDKCIHDLQKWEE